MIIRKIMVAVPVTAAAVLYLNGAYLFFTGKLTYELQVLFEFFTAILLCSVGVLIVLGLHKLWLEAPNIEKKIKKNVSLLKNKEDKGKLSLTKHDKGGLSLTHNKEL